MASSAFFYVGSNRHIHEFICMEKSGGGSEMNIFNNLTGGQIFCIAILGFMLLLMLESLRRELIEKPWPKVAFRWICLIIGCQIMFYGLREIQSGRWTGVI